MRRNHVELRSYDITPPRQNVSDDHTAKREVKPKLAIREINAMTLSLWLYKLRRFGSLERRQP